MRNLNASRNVCSETKILTNRNAVKKKMTIACAIKTPSIARHRLTRGASESKLCSLLLLLSRPMQPGLVCGPEDEITDRPRDIEVPFAHQRLRMVNCVMMTQEGHTGEGAEEGIRGRMVGEVQPTM
jgi:hypothetical protein